MEADISVFCNGRFRFDLVSRLVLPLEGSLTAKTAFKAHALSSTSAIGNDSASVCGELLAERLNFVQR